MSRFRKKDELIGATAAPARGNGDPIFFVDEMPEFTGEERLLKRRRWWRAFHGRVEI